MQPTVRLPYWSTVILGLNAWSLTLLLPMLQVKLLMTSTSWLLAGTGLVCLALGLAMRSRPLLMALFPLILVMALAVQKQIASDAVLTVLRFWLLATSVTIYWLSASWLCAPRGTGQGSLTRLDHHKDYVKWSRRWRLSIVVALLSLALPIILVSSILFDPGVTDSIQEMYTGRSALMKTLLVIIAAVVWGVVFSRIFLKLLTEQKSSRGRIKSALGNIRTDGTMTWLAVRLALAAGLIASFVWFW